MEIQVWQHQRSGERWLAEVDEEGTIAKAAGPLHYSDLSLMLGSGSWDGDPDVVDDLKDKTEFRIKAVPTLDSTLHGVASWSSHGLDDGTDAGSEFAGLCLEVMRLRYPGVSFEDPAGDEFNRLVVGNNWDDVTDWIDYESVTEASPDELRAELR